MAATSNSSVCFRVWHPLPLIGAVFLLSELLPATMQVIVEGGATVFGTALKVVLVALMAWFAHRAVTTVQLDEQAIGVGHLCGRRRQVAWEDVERFQIVQNRPRLLEAINNWGQTPLHRVAFTSPGFSCRVRIPVRRLEDVDSFLAAWERSQERSKAGASSLASA